MRHIRDLICAGFIACIIFPQCQAQTFAGNGAVGSKYYYTNNHIYFFAEPEAKPGKQVDVIPFNSKVEFLAADTRRFKRLKIAWYQIRWQNQIGWVPKKYLQKEKSPAEHAELYPAKSSNAGSEVIEFEFDRKKAHRIAIEEIRKFESDPSYPNYSHEIDYYELAKPTFSAVINIDKNKEKHQVIIVLFEDYFVPTDCAHVILEVKGGKYVPFGRGFAGQPRNKLISEVKNDPDYFVE
ncbi:SH3 domain-containing protein [Turneriella parva]|uniref:Uncharacterized protein n=1 Tax=Turneriella parva (strain ATCC BAA-1111 / DSM 21527 / NCTC 11395 / H) TaxID=869212 RepID=I4B827_TURPD|nr:SH3 domain-containing protein [Turneriella parva]AFM13434.1 hypothetical protein Turpa_2795 [Turneriella parva DSM 21527]